jgi:electron-transferring-flavoprotein dehydrogenase
VIVGGGPGRPRRGDPPEAARAEGGQRGVGLRAREGLRDRRAHPLGRGDGPARAHRAVPDWKERARRSNAGHGRPLPVPDRTRRAHAQLAAAAADGQPRQLHRSLGNVCRWLGQQAEALGVEIYPGFAAAEVLYDDDGAVKGVATGDMGIGKDGEPKSEFPARHGAARQVHAVRRRRARLARQAADREVQPARRRDPQKFGIGIKELWEVEAGEAPARPRPCTRRLAAGRPTPTAARSSTTWRNLVAVGFVVGLDYQNPYLSRSRSSSASRRTRDPRTSKAASASPTARARSPRAAAVAAEARVPRRRADRLRRRLRQRCRASRAATTRSRPACWRPRPRSRRSPPAAAATS